MIRHRRKSWLLPALVLVAALGLILPQPRTAGAHALLLRADPPVNAQLREPPTQLTLYFSEALERRFSSVRVTDQNGTRLDESVEFDDADPALMRVFLKPASPGFLNIAWENVSAVDGHRLSGSFPLTILNPDGTPPPGQPAQASTSLTGEEPTPGRVLTKAVLLISGCLLAGALAFMALVTMALTGEDGRRVRDRVEHLAFVAGGVSLGLLALGGISELILQADDIGASVTDTLDTRWGERWLVRNAVLVLPALALVAMRRTPKLALWLGLAGVAAYFAVTSSVSHAAAGGGAFWAAASDFVHLVTASVWIGMLAFLALLFVTARRELPAGRRYSVLAVGLQRFSLVAIVSVALLLFSGTFNAVVEVGRLSDLIETGYGRTLLAKLLLLVPLLSLAGANAFLLRPQIVEMQAERRTPNRQALLEHLERRLGLTVRWELGVAVLVLAVVALLVQLTPAKGRSSEPGQTPGKYVQTEEVQDLSVTLVVDPNQVGNNAFEIYLAGAVDQVEGVRLEFDKPGNFLGTSRLDMTLSAPPSFYVGQGAFLSNPGDWTITVNIRQRVGSDLRPRYKLDVPETPGAAQATGGRLGGDFDAPFSLTAASAVLLLATGIGCAVLVAASLPRQGLSAGYLGWLAEEAAYRLPPLPRWQPVLPLVVLVVVGIGLGVLIGAHTHGPVSQQEARRDNPIPSSEESVARGRMLFLANCAQCHGDSGRGDGPLAQTLPIPPANLYDHIPFHPDQFFFGVITRGLSGVMPPFENQLSEDDRWNILNFLRDQFGQQPAVQ